MLKTPVAIFIFNRPNCTEQLVHALSVVKPAHLFVIADGPRNANDIELCKQTRAIIDQIDWPCSIVKRYATSNIGCRESIPNGLNWVFEQVDACIILEDDCIPQPSFFPFCQELLSRYKHDERVMTVGGHRSDGPNELGTESYYFSKSSSIFDFSFIPFLNDLKPLPNSLMTFGNLPAPNNTKTMSNIKSSSPNLPDIIK